MTRKATKRVRTEPIEITPRECEQYWVSEIGSKKVAEGNAITSKRPAELRPDANQLKRRAYHRRKAKKEQQ